MTAEPTPTFVFSQPTPGDIDSTGRKPSGGSVYQNPPSLSLPDWFFDDLFNEPLYPVGRERDEVPVSLGLVGTSERSSEVDSVRLSRKAGVEVREETAERVKIQLGESEFVRTEAKTWGQALEAWEAWIERYDPLGIRFVDTVTGEVVTGDLETSYSPSYARRYYAKFKSLEDGVEAEYDDPSTVMLTFTASNRDEDRNYRPPVDHIDEIASTWRNNTRQQLRYVIEEKLGIEEWCYGTIMEPHKSGYGHLHTAVFVDGEIDPEDLQPVMETHVKNCEGAGPEAHEYKPSNPEDSAISVNRNSEIGNLGSYLAEYLGEGSFDDPLEKPRYIRRFCAMVWASGLRRIRFNNRGYELMEIGESEYAEGPKDPSTVELVRGDRAVDMEPDFDRAEVVIPQDDGTEEIKELTGGRVNKTEIKKVYYDRPSDDAQDDQDIPLLHTSRDPPVTLSASASETLRI